MSITQARLLSLAGRALATVALAAAAGVLHAQTAQDHATTQTPQLNLQLPADLQTSTDDATFSSSVTAQEPLTTTVAKNDTDQFHFLNAMQYGGGRQRYGRPRYRGGNTNADGSSKYDFFVGGGVGIPVGSQSNYLTPSWGLQLGGGRNFNKHIGVNLQFDYDHFGMTGATIDNYAALYGDPTNTNGFDANSHIWSFSLDPIFYLYQGEGMGAYVTGGVGFYHKVANFTLPETGTYCDYYGFCYQYQANQVIDHYTSNALGENVGVGLTYKFSKFASEQLYAEVRYVHMNNQYRPGILGPTDFAYTGNNFFPQNSQKTSYLPVKFGIRF
jgi:hypothetical protein